ncbi:MAG TPA: glycosyltransferase family 39 protein, partial [Chloroflexota bacterium]|nr:glycosyltransferase family 39 protein [Chloroflexota bacterium]
GDAPLIQALFQVVRVDGRWQIATRVAAAPHLADASVGAPSRSASTATSHDDPASMTVRRFHAAHAQGDATAGEALWASVSWAYSAVSVPELRNGQLREPFALITCGAPSITGQQRITWHAAADAPAHARIIGHWPLASIAWVLAEEGQPSRRGLAYTLYLLANLPRRGWRIAARVEYSGFSASARPVPPAAPDPAVGISAPEGATPAAASPRPAPTSRFRDPARHPLRHPRLPTLRLPFVSDPLLLAAALACGAMGQLSFDRRPPSVLVGTLWFLLGIAAFTLPWLRDRWAGAAREVEPVSLAAPSRAATLGTAPTGALRLWRLALLGTSVLSTLLLLGSLTGRADQPAFPGHFLLWLTSITTFVAGITLERSLPNLPSLSGFRAGLRLSDWRGPARYDRALLLGIGGLTLVSLVLRLWHIDAIPATLGGDEGSQGLETLKVLNGGIRNPFSTGWLGVPAMSFYFNALSVGPLGNTAFALRLPWALVGSATVVAVFFLVRRVAGVTLAWPTAALLAAYHYHVHFSRLGSNQVADPFFVAVSLLFLYRGYAQRRPLDWALAGVVIGVSQYFYAGARFTGLLVAAVVVFWLLTDGARSFWRDHRRGILALAGAALVTAAPMAQYSVRNSDAYNARLNQVGILQSGWLAREQEIRKQGAVPILVYQLQRAALAFNAYPDRTFWYGSPRPLFQFIPAVLFLLGLGFATLRLLNPRFFPFVAWWWGAVITGGMLTESPPSSMRLITLAPPAVFFVALALVRVARLLQPALGAAARPSFRPAVALGTAVLSMASINFYFTVYTPLRVYGNPTALIATELSRYAKQELGPQSRLYFFGAPRMYVDFGSIPYLLPEVEGVDVREPLRAPPGSSLVKPDKSPVFVFLPERLAELDLVRQTFPGGNVVELPDPRPGARDSLALVYRPPVR